MVVTIENSFTNISSDFVKAKLLKATNTTLSKNSIVVTDVFRQVIRKQVVSRRKSKREKKKTKLSTKPYVLLQKQKNSTSAVAV